MSEEPGVSNAVELIEGSQAIRDYFGRWPSFHDAEIVEIHLNREEPSWLKIYTAIDGFHPEQKVGTIVFHFKEILNLDLGDFSPQNVVSSIDFEKTERGLKASLWPCYGLSGWLEVTEMSVELVR